MTDTSSAPSSSGAAPDGSPPVSEDQAREYLAQLRSAPAEQLITELLSGLLNAAQVKLGRRDARLLIDLSAVVVDHARPHLHPDLARQVDQLLGQLRLGQVQAESKLASQPAAEPNDLAQVPTPPAGAASAGQAPAGQAPAGQARAGQAPPGAASPGAAPGPRTESPLATPPSASRLWVPGRPL